MVIIGKLFVILGMFAFCGMVYMALPGLGFNCFFIAAAIAMGLLLVPAEAPETPDPKVIAFRITSYNRDRQE